MVATRTPATPARLPTGDPSQGRGGQVAKGLLALVTMGVIVVGAPVALYAAFGTPWPDSAPSTDWIYSDFTARDALAVLVAVVWLAWAHFVLCLLVELVTERKGRGLPPNVPGGSVGTQPLARRLVGAALLLAGGTALAMPAASATTVAAHQQQIVVADKAPMADAAGNLPTADPTAGHAPDEGKGDGARTFTEEAKSGAVEKYVVVQPPEGRHYDTLWGISERYLGDGMRYKEILHLNRGVVQPDGTALQNPDLIYPGWVLRLPGDATGPGLMESNKSPEQPAKTGASTDKTQGADQATGDKSGSTADHAGTAANGGGPGGVTESDSVNASAVTAGGFGAGGALLAAGLLFGLRRRRGWDGGPNPRGGKKLDSEFDLRENADESSAYFLDKVLRGVTNSVPEQGTLPAPTSCVLGADGLALTFPADARVRLDAPWKGEPGGRAWGISRADARELPKSSGLSPLPGLVPVGHSGQGLETLLDIESISGITSLSGDLDVARDVAVSMGLGLATSKWTDLPRVTFIGFADDLSELAPDSIRHYDDLSELFERLEARRRRQHNACAAHGYDSVLTGRLADSDERLWSPEFVVLSGVPNEDDVNRLASLAADPRNSVGVIVVGDVIDAPVRMVASSEGRLWCGPLGIDVVAHRMTAETYRDALGIFDAEIVRGGASDPSGPDTPAGGIAAPVVDPDALDLTQPMPVEISTLGDVHVSAPGEVDDGRRQLLTEILVFLALHPEGIHPNVLAGAVWPRGVEDDVRDAALAQAATWVGVDEQGTPRLHVNDDGAWVLSRSGVRLDWDVFRGLANRSATQRTDPMGDLELAMSLVTGPAWTNLPAKRYGWLTFETVEADVRIAVVAVSRRLAQLAAEAGDPLRARNALVAGLRMVPACEELWRDALRLARRFASAADVSTVAHDMYATIGRHGSPRGAEPETDALVDELIPGYRRSAA